MTTPTPLAPPRADAPRAVQPLAVSPRPAASAGIAPRRARQWAQLIAAVLALCLAFAALAARAAHATAADPQRPTVEVPDQAHPH